MKTGVIKKLVTDKGFGFLTPDGDNKDLFFHATTVRGVRFEELLVGHKVEYEIEFDSRRNQNRAINVRLVE